jgi:hypothetical protein
MISRKAIAAAAAAAALGAAGIGVGPMAFGAFNTTTCSNTGSLNPQGGVCSGPAGDSGTANATPTGTNNGGNATLSTGGTSTAVGSVIVGKGSSHSKTSVHNKQSDQGTAKANAKTGKGGNTGTGLDFHA